MKWKIGGLLTLVLALAVAAPLLAQGLRGRGNALGRLENILELNAAQTTAAQALLERNRASQQSLMERARRERQDLQTLIQAGTDPAAIGRAVLAGEATRAEMRANQERLLADFKNLLTASQREQFEALERAGRGFMGMGPWGGFPMGPGGRGAGPGPRTPGR